MNPQVAKSAKNMKPPLDTIAEAAEWRLIGLLLERPRPGWRDEITAVSREVRNPALRAAAEAARDATEGAYLGVLGPGGSVSPREVTYRSFEDPGHVLAALATAYQAFGFQPRAEDPIDHIAVEAGFVGYLFLKEAFAAARGDADAAATTAAARQGFIETHLAAWAAPLAQRLAAAAPVYLVAVAQALAARVPAPPQRATATGADLPDIPAGCGTCSLD